MTITIQIGWIRDGWHQRWGIPAETTGLEYPPEQGAYIRGLQKHLGKS